MSSPSRNSLDYAPRPPLLRRPRFWRKIALLLLVMAAAWSAWHWGPPLYVQARTEHWRRECFSYTLAPDIVVFEADPAAAGVLLKRDGYSPITLSVGQPPGAAWNVPACGKLLSHGMDIEPGLEALLFLHRLTTRGGQSRVVAIQFNVNQCPVPDRVIDPPVALFINKFLPDIEGVGAYATLLRDREQRPFTAQCYGFWTALNDRSLRFYAGQADPNDPSHFTIGYSVHGQRGMIDGWAEDAFTGVRFAQGSDEERQWHVRLVVRDGPAKGGLTVQNASDIYEALYETDPNDQYAQYLVAGRVTDFGCIADSHSQKDLIWRLRITHVYSGRKDLLGKSFGIMGSMAAYPGEPDVPPVLQVGEEGIWWVSRESPVQADPLQDSIWGAYYGKIGAEGRAMFSKDYPEAVEWAQTVEKVESTLPAQRSALLRELLHHSNHRIAEWASENLPRR